MASLLEMLSQQLGAKELGGIGAQLGTDEKTTQHAVSAALPLLLSALSRNASRGQGASALSAALAKDHDGSILDDVMGFLGQASSGPGDGILRHVLGERRGAVEAGIGRSAGLDSGSVSKLLTMLAPVVMGALGRQQRQSNLDAGGLAELLSGERKQAERQAGPDFGLLTSLLDADGDGVPDIAGPSKSGLGGLLGKLLGGK